MIHVIATIEIADGQRERFLNEIRQLVPLVLQEAGCVEYDPAVDLQTNLDAQPDVRSNVVTIVEKWENAEALEAHLIAGHMLKYRARVKEMVNQVTLQVLEPA